MDFLLQRFSDNRDSTLGILLKKMTGYRTVFQAYSLEDEFRESKVSGETRIPEGKYELVLQKQDTPKTKQYRAKYPWFKHHIMVNNVPGFTGIYIHIGNDDEDTDGCILLGDNADNNVIGPGSVSNSTASFRRFYDPVYEALASGQKVTLEIRNENKLLL